MLSFSVLASEWIEIFSTTINGEGIVVYIDSESIQRRGDTANAWLKMEFTTEPVMFAVSYYLVDCKERTFSILETTLYNESGHPIATFKSSEKDFIIPDTFSDFLYRLLCR